MDEKKPAYFDLKTVATLREALEDAWFCLPPEKRATTSRTLLAEPMLKLAAQGERDPDRLREYALTAIAGSYQADAAA